MTLKTSRRSLIKGAGALGLGGLLGISGQPLRAATTPSSGGTFRLGVASFDTGDLIEIGPGGVLEPELATSWSANDDLSVWTFKLREGVEFHNGKTMTSEDVVFSDIKANGPYEISVELDGPNSSFPAVMALFSLVIVPAGDMDFDKGIGTGGYILESFEPGVKSVVKRNPNYWKAGRAHFDKIEILAIRDVNARTTALQTGQIDAMNAVDPTTAALMSRLPGVDLLQTQGKVHYCFSMITTDPLFSNPDVRKAMKLAIDREDMVKKVLGGYGSVANDQPISEAYQYFNGTIAQHSYDPDQAKALLKSAGAEGLKTTLHASDTPFTGAVDAAQLFSEHASAAGINIEVSREPDDGYWSNIWGKKPFFASRWSGRANEDLMLTLAYSKEALGDYNATNWDNDAFNKALVAARSEKDDEQRKALYWECQSLLHDDGGVIAPVWADFLDAKSSKVSASEKISGDWDLDGCRASERWWFNA